jgi:predicted nucleic acid-binding protein
MKIFLDTSVLVAAVVEKHESNERAFRILDRVQNSQDEGYVSAHSLAEMYAVLTKSPPPQRHTSEQAMLSIEENVVKFFKIVWLTDADYTALIREAALAGVQGGTIYDALLLKCAAKSNAETLYTLNLRHFQNVAPKDFASRILAP